MKKLYILILASLFLSNLVNAQGLVLTKAFYEPVVGDGSTRFGYDSVGVIPKNTGLNQVWDLSNMVWNNATSTSSFVVPSAAAPFNTCCSQSNIVEKTGTNSYNFWQSNGTSFVLWGLTASTIALTFTNSAVVSVWPLSYTYSNTDAFAGTAKSGTLSGPATGSIIGTGLGTGTVILPSGLTFTNCLHTKVHQSASVSFLFGTITATITSTNYQFYDANYKFPLININYNKVNSNVSSFNSNNCDIFVNGLLYTGINNLNFEKNYTMFPNPAKDKITIQLSNISVENANIEILNATGQVVKSQNLPIEKGGINAECDVTSLSPGIYFVKTTLDGRSSTKKLIIE